MTLRELQKEINETMAQYPHLADEEVSVEDVDDGYEFSITSTSLRIGFHSTDVLGFNIKIVQE